MTSRDTVFMVVSGSLREGLPKTNSFVKTQADSIRVAGWNVCLGVVDDRTSFRGVIRNIRRLKIEIAQVKPRLVHAQYGSVTAAVANIIKGPLPLIVSFCGDDLLGTPMPGWAWRLRESCARSIGFWAARRASAIVVKSHNLHEALPADLRTKSTVLPNGVDTDWFKPMDRDCSRSILGWKNSSKIILFNESSNEDRYRKNPSLARAAFDITARAVPDVLLQVVSQSSSEEMRLMMNAADCLLVTSLHEGSPNIVKEAMSCNLPVVSVPCGDVAERLKMTHPGAVCSYNPSALAEAVIDVLKAGHRSNGRQQLITQGLTASKVAESLIRIYHRVQEQRHGLTSESLCVE
jgi:glycosyltransferase involved in cell wall biosynthesis